MTLEGLTTDELRARLEQEQAEEANLVADLEAAKQEVADREGAAAAQAGAGGADRHQRGHCRASASCLVLLVPNGEAALLWGPLVANCDRHRRRVCMHPAPSASVAA